MKKVMRFSQILIAMKAVMRLKTTLFVIPKDTLVGARIITNRYL